MFAKLITNLLCMLNKLMYGFIFGTYIMSYNHINHILTTNKLTEPNYIDWKRNLDIVLTSEELKWVT